MSRSDIQSEMMIEPLTQSNWALFEDLLGEKGGCGGCWCMAFRLSSGEFERNKYSGNKDSLKKLVDEGKPTGLMAIEKGRAIGWISIAPREQFKRLNNSRVHKRLDELPVWSITCFFIRKEYRGQGYSEKLIESAKQFAIQNKIVALEAYPVKPYAQKMPDVFAWTGIHKSFLKAGFEMVSEASKSKPMMRWFPKTQPKET